ncbi:MAG: T9SS type A sorting domain-containing protein [Bacteroidetes bacterium]|jgi:agmatine/peptidylarginine deiminase/PKD repeat protein|nr:T9SS type A sorting domain-containing protein [Bacteroidota bacterium]
MKASYITLVLYLGLAISLPAQQPFSYPQGTPVQLPAEESLLDYTLLDTPNTPPPAPVRLMAEWEEAQALLVSWRNEHTELLREIVRHGVNECTVYVFVKENLDAVADYLEAGGVPLDNVVLLQAPYNSIWIRDYGPWTIYHNDVDSLMIADWRYNRPTREDDDKIPAFIAEHLGLPVFEAADPPYRWVHAGGNNLRDGMGTIFSSDLVLEENPDKTEAEIDELAELFLGAGRYVKLPRLPYDVISHLDMHMRFIDEETVFIGQYPEGVADGPQIEANIEYLRNEVLTPFGNHYNILRLPMPPDGNDRYPDQGGDYRTYTNSLFLNGTVMVPIYEEKYDTTALRLYRENLPGYNVVGIDCNDIIPRFGAIHCITKIVGVADPLWIAHPRLRDTDNTEEDYETYAIIKHRSGIVSANLHYRIAGEDAYTAIPMALTDTTAARWSAAIPAQPENTVVEYYIAAEAHNGKQQVRPIVAPEGYFRFKVDALRPAFSPAQQTLCPGGSITFSNSTEGAYDSLRWHFPGGTPSTTTEQNPAVIYTEGGQYDVLLIAYGEGIADTLQRQQAVTVKSLYPPYLEDFSASFQTDIWAVENPDEDAARWERVEGGSCDPGAMRIEHFFNDTRGTSDFFRANFDLSGLEKPALTFDLAYAMKASFFQDGLRVHIIDCEGQKTTVFEQFGEELASTDPSVVPFVPEDCSDWKSVTLPLDAFAGQGITVEFESVGDFGNNIYIDLVDIGELMPDSAPASLEEAGLSLRLFPNPAREQVFLEVLSPRSGTLNWQLYDALGRTLRSGQQGFTAGQQRLPLRLGDLPAGLYKLEVGVEGARSAYKLQLY